MPDGIRAELAVHGLSNCPVAALSAERDESVTGVRWTRDDGRLVEEFRVDDDVPADALAGAESLVDLGDERVYRYSREVDGRCACEIVESFDAPPADVRVDSGTLVLTLHLGEAGTLRDVVRELDAVADRIEMRYVVHASGDDDGAVDRTLVDRGRLTDRQREVLEVAYERGYFEYPGGANATEVAAELDIGLSTFAEHLAAAQSKLLDDLLGGA
ncbi:MAG: helix-turn-helix domain-containing protein [Haloferacaceae archaeon]